MGEKIYLRYLSGYLNALGTLRRSGVIAGLQQETTSFGDSSEMGFVGSSTAGDISISWVMVVVVGFSCGGVS